MHLAKRPNPNLSIHLHNHAATMTHLAKPTQPTTISTNLASIHEEENM